MTIPLSVALDYESPGWRDAIPLALVNQRIRRLGALSLKTVHTGRTLYLTSAVLLSQRPAEYRFTSRHGEETISQYFYRNHGVIIPHDDFLLGCYCGVFLLSVLRLIIFNYPSSYHHDEEEEDRDQADQIDMD